MTFKKGKFKGSNAYKCIDGHNYSLVIENDEFYKIGNRIYVTTEQFKRFHNFNEKDKEEYLYFLKEEGRINRILYRFNTVDLKLPKKREIKIK